jgi:hypothetical protein
MAKAFGLILMLAAMYVGMTLYTQGLEQAFGGIFAPIDSHTGGESRTSALADDVKLHPTEDPSPVRRRVPITEQVRDRVNQHIQRGAARNERSLR